MEKVDLPEDLGAGEGAEDLELELETTPERTSTEPSGDPLDDIQDETARAEAKKARAIARRVEKKEETPKAQSPEAKPDTSQFLTKTDFYKSNERKAIREITADVEIKAAWNEIIPFYTPRRGKETSEDIKEDIQDAITLYKARNPVVEKDDSADQLTTTPVTKTGGGTIDKVIVKSKDPPNFKLPVPPKEWYAKKS